MKRSRSSFDRFTDWVLDVDGDIYGVDERERLRWYEAISVSASVQLLLFPWAIAGFAWFGDRRNHSVLGWVLVMLYLPSLLMPVYVSRHKVDPMPFVWSRKRAVIALLGTLPLFAFAAAVGQSRISELDGNGLIGGIFGGSFSIFAMWLYAKRHRARLERRQKESD
jgi:MFS family permease